MKQRKGVPLPNPWEPGDYGDGFPPPTLEELAMLRIRAEVMEKPQWRSKVGEPSLRSKWRQELLLSHRQSPQTVDYALQEMLHLASVPNAPPVDGGWLSDSLLPELLAASFAANVRPLELSCTDWHPRSDQQVLDLVHPSLYPLVSGVTRGADGETLRLPRAAGSNTSERFQWLPAEFRVSDLGKTSIRSYINNLNPRHHTPLYLDIAGIFSRFVPLFENVIADLRSPRPPRHSPDMYSLYPEFSYEAHEECDSHEDADAAWDEFNENKEPNIEPVGAFEPPPPVDPVSLRGRTLRVIVKIGEIVLTPEKPEYPGGSWHVEGMKNEFICATGIYYFGEDNVSPSELHFRKAVCEPDYEQDDRLGVESVYGLADEEALVQPAGRIVTKAGRCVAFPNVYQHQVQPFKLLDATKPGRRKILVFFLCDPDVDVISTASVPPQQASWRAEDIDATGALAPLLPELRRRIYSYLDWMTPEQAEEYRLQLMDERSQFLVENGEQVFNRPLSLCEH